MTAAHFRGLTSQSASACAREACAAKTGVKITAVNVAIVADGNCIIPALRAYPLTLDGCSSVGRASVSKTEGRGFESLRPCQTVLIITCFDIQRCAGLSQFGCAAPPGVLIMAVCLNEISVNRISMLGAI